MFGKLPSPHSVLIVLLMGGLVATGGYAWAQTTTTQPAKVIACTSNKMLFLADPATQECPTGQTRVELTTTAYTGFLGATAKAVDADKLDGEDSTAFLGAAAKAADAEKLDGFDSTGFVRGRHGTDFRRVITRNNFDDAFSPAPFGQVATYCDTAANEAIFYYVTAHDRPVDVWQQVNGGAPSFRTLSGDDGTGEQKTVAPTRYTLELSDGTHSGEIDIWMRYSNGSCKFILRTSSGNSP